MQQTTAYIFSLNSKILCFQKASNVQLFSSSGHGCFLLIKSPPRCKGDSAESHADTGSAA